MCAVSGSRQSCCWLCPSQSVFSSVIWAPHITYFPFEQKEKKKHQQVYDRTAQEPSVTLLRWSKRQTVFLFSPLLCCRQSRSLGLNKLKRTCLFKWYVTFAWKSQRSNAEFSTRVLVPTFQKKAVWPPEAVLTGKVVYSALCCCCVFCLSLRNMILITLSADSWLNCWSPVHL